MKLTDAEFKRLKELQKLDKAGKLSDKDKQEYAELFQKWKDKSKDEGKAFKPGNDFSWWNKLTELTRDCASFKCNWIPGTSIAPGLIDEIGFGAFVVCVDTSYGLNTKATDPINVWARDLYLRMFQKYRPASGYTASDLGIMLLAMLEVVKIIAYYERIYGVINRYSKLNVNMPTTEAFAMGLSSATLTYLQGHLSDFRYDLNYLIRKAQRLCIPKDMSFIAQAISFFGYEYIDHDSPRGQFILFKPNEYGVYSDVKLSSGGSIEFKDTFITDLFDFNASNMCKALTTVIDALLGSDSIQRISADLFVWFGEDAMLQFLPIPDDYIVVPVKSDSILHEVHNLESLSDIPNRRLESFADSNLSSADASIVGAGHFIYQVDDRIVTTQAYISVPSGVSVSQVTTTIDGAVGTVGFVNTNVPKLGYQTHCVDSYVADYTPEVVIEGSVLKAAGHTLTAPGGIQATIIVSANAYIVTGVETYKVSGRIVELHTYCDANSAISAVISAGYFSPLDWAPLTFEFDAVDHVNYVYGEYDNVAPVSLAELTRVQRTTLLSGLHTDIRVVNK